LPDCVTKETAILATAVEHFDSC